MMKVPKPYGNQDEITSGYVESDADLFMFGNVLV
jgi:hypothetical protein